MGRPPVALGPVEVRMTRQPVPARVPLPSHGREHGREIVETAGAGTEGAPEASGFGAGRTPEGGGE